MTGKALDLVVTDRWHRLIGGIRPLSVARQVTSYERPKVDPSGPPPQAFIREMFVPAEPAMRRTLDLFCVGLIERDPPDGDDYRSGELVLLGPETIRAHTSLSAPGFTVADLRIGSADPEVRAVSMMLMRITRITRAHDLVVSIEDLGRLLDYQHDAAGSAAVAQAILRRLEVLVGMRGTEVPVVGTITRRGDAPGVEAHHLLVNRQSPLSFDDDLRVRDGHLVIVPADGRTAHWRDGDFMLVRFGQQPGPRGEMPPLAQLRREHELVEIGLGLGLAPTAAGLPGVSESYSSRAASARQSSWAEQIVRHALAGDTASAVTTYRAAMTEPGAEGPLADGIAGRVKSVGDYWVMRGVLAEATDDVGASPSLEAVARIARERLDDRLDQLLGLIADVSDALFIPVTTPLVFEVSDALIPFVDSRQDGGVFLEELIPAMRDRILTRLGVVVPGIRASSNPNLPPGGFTTKVDEVTVSTSTALISGSYALRPLSDEELDPEAELTDTHPLTGEPGLWQVTPVWNDTVEGGGDPTKRETEHLTPAQYLIHQIDTVFRSHLARFLGLQEVASLVDQWTAAERDLVTSVLPDQAAVVRLTWVLQALVEERIPITEWRSILSAIRDAGGSEMPMRALARAARARLRRQLPGPRSGPRVVFVPEELQEALARHLGTSRLPLDETMHEFQRWLRGAVSSNGPALSLVTRDEDIREAVVALTRSHYRLVTAFTEEDVVFE